MIRIRDFIKAGGGLSDGDLASLMRDMMAATTASEQRGWLRQVELSLDGYGGGLQLSAIERVRIVLKQLNVELDALPRSAVG